MWLRSNVAGNRPPRSAATRVLQAVRLQPSALAGIRSNADLGTPVEKAVIALEYLGQASAQLVELLLTEHKLNDDYLLATQDRQGSVLELDNGVVMKQFEALDSLVTRSILVIHLNLICVRAEHDVLGLRRLPTL